MMGRARAIIIDAIRCYKLLACFRIVEIAHTTHHRSFHDPQEVLSLNTILYQLVNQLLQNFDNSVMLIMN